MASRGTQSAGTWGSSRHSYHPGLGRRRGHGGFKERTWHLLASWKEKLIPKDIRPQLCCTQEGSSDTGTGY